DPWVAQWLEANPLPDDLSPEFVALARGSFEVAATQEIARVRDEMVSGVPVRIYEHAEEPTGLVVYFHGGGFCIGSVALMDNVARELAHVTGAAVISVEYRLAPEHPYPAGLDDCETVTRWALAHAPALGVSARRVVVAGESAGGNLAAAVTLRLRDAHSPRHPVGQILIYPVLDARGSAHPSREEFLGLVISAKMDEWFWTSYAGGRQIDVDPYAAPLQAPTLADLPPALVILGGCDVLRDEGRAFAQRLREAHVETEEVCYPGQPHGFVNLGFPAARDAYDTIGQWARCHLAAVPT
ncbi:MAG TPA: alpha/beta hydrolase, partial [Acidimicrobiales bacterium]|nr:alpha/beta hydrolase [Acidimicrobiales bacterium]